jgi:predicted DNA-binding antitoxin AbrB/MazE fold protein
MSQKLRAIYEKGVLRPLSGLPLPEHAEVELEIHLQQDPGASEKDQLREIFVAAGLSSPEPDTISNEFPLPDQERRQELARLFSKGQPLSELIIKDREGR